MPQGELAVAGLMAVELKAGLVCDQRLKQRLALDELKARDIPTLDVQKIESVINEARIALAVGRRLRLGEAWQSGIVDAAKLAVDVGGLHVQVRECCDGAWIFVGPIEPGPSQKLNAAVVDARGHAEAVEFDFMQPLRARGRLLDRLEKLGRDEARKGNPSARSTGLDGLRGRTLDDARHDGA